MRDVLRTPGALSLFAASCVARLPMGALGLLLVLHTHALTGSYAAGGLASGAYALALAAGFSQPPVGACMRALWPVLLDTPARRHSAYALEGAVLEIVYICGPVVIVAGIGAWSLHAALVACAAALLAGDLAFSTHPVSRRWRPGARSTRDLTGALRGGGVRVLAAVFALLGLSIGAVEVAVPATLDGMGHRDLTGLLLGVWGVGSMLAGLAVARTGVPADAPRRLAVLP